MATKVTHKLNQLDSDHKLNQLDSELASTSTQLNLIRARVSALRESDRAAGYAVDILLDAIDKLNEAAENLEDSRWLLTRLQSK